MSAGYAGILTRLLITAMLLVPAVALPDQYGDVDDKVRFFALVRDNDIEAVRRMLEEGMDPDVRGRSTSETALMVAAHHGRVEIIDLLIAAGAGLNREDANGMSVLDKAVANNKPEAMKRLLRAGAKIGGLGRGGPYLLFGVIKEQKPDELAHALRIAVSSHDSELLDLLIDAGADINAADSRTGQTALMYAASLAYPQMVTALLKRGVSVRTKDKNGFTAIDHSLGKSRVPSRQANVEAIIMQLLDAGLRPHDRQVFLFYKLAIDMADMQMLEKLVASVGPDSPPGAQDSPLHHAVWSRKPDMVLWLLQHGADTEWRDREGKTAIVSVLSDPQLFELMHSHGADLDTRDNFGHGLLWHLMRYEHPNPAVFRALMDTESSAAELGTDGGISHPGSTGKRPGNCQLAAEQGCRH